MGKRKRKVDLQFPSRGLEEGAAYRRQAPFSTPDAQNVWPDDTLEERTRGGSRACLEKAYDTQLGSGAKIRMLAPVTIVSTDGLTVWNDVFDGSTMGDTWTAVAWDPDGLPSILPDDLSGAAYNEDVGGVADAADPSIDATNSYEIGVYIAPYAGAHSGKHQIYLALNDTTPALLTDGVVAEIVMTGSTGTWTGSFVVYNATTPTTYTFTAGTSDLGHAPSGWFKVLYDPTTPNVKAYWRGQLLKSQNITLGGNAGDRYGFGMECTVAGGITLVDQFKIQYYADDLRERRRNILVASSNGSVYRETFGGTMLDISATPTIATDRRIDAAQSLQKLYIADHGNPVIDTTSSISGTTLTASGITASTVDKDDCMVEISSGTGTITDGLYGIAAVGTGSLTLSSNPGTGNCSARIERAPKIFDPSDNSLAILTPTTGQYPLGAGIIFFYRDRLAFALDNILYYSRQGTYTDFDFGVDADDVAKAIASDYADAGQIGDIITAAVPFHDDYVVIGGQNSMWLQEGDLAFSGEIVNMTTDTSIIMCGAHCCGPGGSLYFLGPDGVNYVETGRTPTIRNLTSGRIPRQLRSVNPSVYQVNMVYDHRRSGVHIYLSPENPTGRVHWFYSVVKDSFWKMSLQNDHDAMSVLEYSNTQLGDVGVLLGCRDGYIRSYSDYAERDDDSGVTAYIDIGPFNLGDDVEAGSLDSLIGVLGKNSGDITWSVRIDEDHETVTDSSTSVATGTWVAGKNYPVHVRGYGKSCVVRVTGAGTNRRWALERITALLSKRGFDRDLG